MIILAIEQSTASGSAALLQTETNIVLDSETWNHKGLRNQSLFNALPSLLSRNKLSVSDIEAFAIGLGPGRYSGLRISLSAVRGMAAPQSVLIHGISSPRIMAANFRNSPEGTIITITGDARRDTIWYSTFEISNGSIKEIQPLSLSPYNHADKALENSGIVATSELERLENLLSRNSPANSLQQNNIYPRANHLAALAAEDIKQNIASLPITPIYMHPPVKTICP